MDLYYLQLLIGFIGLTALAIPFSSNIKEINYKNIAVGILFQIFLAFILIKIPIIVSFFKSLGDGVIALQDATKKGTSFLFGFLSSPGLPFVQSDPSAEIESAYLALGINGYAYDMLVGCSSTTFAISNAYSDIASGLASTILVINPELTSPGNDFKIRDSHFIFGDACVATIVQGNLENPKDVFQIKDRELVTQFSNNIRSDFSYMNRTDDLNRGDEVMFRQNGRSVFKEVCPMVVEIITNQLTKLKLIPDDVKRFWLHQANGNMINFVAKKLKGEDYEPNSAPMILEKYGNVASAGSVIAFHETKGDFKSGEMGVICSFGAGYSICSLVVEKV